MKIDIDSLSYDELFELNHKIVERLKFLDSMHTHKEMSNRSQVQGSTFRVKDKEGIENPKSSLQMFIFPSNCQFSFKFWIRTDETDTFLVSTHPKCSPGTRMEP